MKIDVTGENGEILTEVRVAASADDAEENTSGSSVDLTSTDLELILDGSVQQKVGMRFKGIDIPQRATMGFTYTPAANFGGSDSFTYHANDGKADSNVATASTTITPLDKAPVPTISSRTPLSCAAGAPGSTLTVKGAGFVTYSVVRWKGSDCTATFVSSTRLTAEISAADIAVAGTAQVTVFNPKPAGGTPAAQSFVIN